MPTRNPPATKAEAERDCALVTEYLAKGYPALSKRGDTKHRSAVRAAADALGVSDSTFTKRIGTPDAPGSHFRAHGLRPDWGIASARGELGFDPVLPGYEVTETMTRRNGGGALVAQSVRQRRAPAKAASPIPKGHVVKGVSTLLDGQGRKVAEWVKTREGMTPADMVAAIRKAFEGVRERAPALPPPSPGAAELATIYPIPDAHLGLLTWAPETGMNWDLAIARATIREAFARLVAQTPASDQAVVLGLGDLLHSDGYAPLTPQSKHALDVDGRWPKILRAAVEVMIEAVEAARAKHGCVLVRVLPGNHDGESAIAVALGLALYYRDDPNVTVDDDPSYFWWWSWGDTLLGATHGDAAKMADLPLIMATRQRAAWGRAKFAAILTGHVHNRSAMELCGVPVESFQTPVPPDGWHAKQGYGAGRSLSAITYHLTRGEIGRARVPILPPEESTA